MPLPSPETEHAEIPAGNLALVFTDIEKSTALWEKLGDTMAKVLDRHNAIMRHLSEVHRAYEVKTEGDSFFLYFEVAENALAFCLDAQERLRDEAWPENLLSCPEAGASDDGLFRGLRVRMGIHCGEPIIKLDTTTGRIDLHGPVVNAAARISSAAHGGQVLISGRYAELIGKEGYLKESVLDHGEHRLRGLEFSYRLIEVLPKSLEGRRFPELNTLHEYRHNLPLKPTSFIGREEELNDIENLFSGGHRFVTVTGAGGAGKSRITLRYGASHLEDYPGGVWFVPLMDVTTESGITEVVANVVGIPCVADNMVENVGRAINSRGRALFVFDNFEQLVEHGLATMGQWQTLAPEASFLVSSQVPLHIENEMVYTLEPLAYPQELETETGEPREDLEDFPALRLFIERARAASSTFKATSKNIEDIAVICRHLDGIPLALELAAARSHALTPKQIVDKLPRRFALLKGANKDLSDRKSTLFGAIQWSWDLLNSWEQSTLIQTTVFNGGFTLEMAEEVINLEGFPEADLVMDAIQNLREKNLLRSWHPTDAEEEIRFDHYESIKRFVESLEETGEVAESASQRYSIYCRKVVKFCKDYISEHGEIDRGGLRTVTSNHLDFINVGYGLVEDGDVIELAVYFEVLSNILSRTGNLQLNHELGKKVWKRVSAEGSIDLAYSTLRNHAANPPSNAARDETLPIIQEYIKKAEHSGNIQAQVQLLTLYSLSAGELMTSRERLDVFRRAADLARTGADDWTLAGILVNLCSLEFNFLNPDDALKIGHEAIDIAQKIGQAQMIALTRVNIAAIHFHRGDLAKSLSEAEEAYRLILETQWHTRVANVLLLMSYLWFGIGDNQKPKILLDEYRIKFRENKGSISDPTKANLLEVEIAIAHKNWDEALNLLEVPLNMTDEIEMQFMRGRAFYGKGDIEAARAQFSNAWKLTVENKQKTLESVKEGLGASCRVGLSKKTGIVLGDEVALGELDELFFKHDMFFLDMCQYLMVMGHRALALNDVKAIDQYSSKLEELCEKFTIEGTRLAPSIAGLRQSCQEFREAQIENRQPRLFKGFHLDCLNAEEKTAWKQYLSPTEFSALEPSIRDSLMYS